MNIEDPFYSFSRRPIADEGSPEYTSTFSHDVGYASRNNTGAISGLGASFPFRATDTSSATATRATIWGGKLHRSDLETNVTITGLGTGFNLQAGQKWWLEVAVTNLDPVTAEIKQGSVFPSKFTTTGSADTLVQTKFAVPIGYVFSGTSTLPGFDFKIGNDTYHFEQLLNSHLLVQLMSAAGYTLVFALPWSGT